MELYTSVWHILSAALVFVFGLVVSMRVGSRFGAVPRRVTLIYFWHTLLCMVNLWYTLTYGSDSLEYFRQAQRVGVEFDLGTSFVNFFTSILVQVFGLSFLGVYFVYNFIGTIGLLAFDGCLREATRGKNAMWRHLATVIVFLPSVSFWSSALGKDAVAFMATGLALWAALALSRRSLVMACAVVAMMLVRPHMAGLMVIGLVVGFVADSGASMGRRVVLGAFAVAVSTALIPLALRYAGVGDGGGTQDLVEYFEKRQSFGASGVGAAVDLSSMSFPMQLFTYMFRPLIIEARTVFDFAAAVENLILLYLSVAGVVSQAKYRRVSRGENRVFMWTYALLAWGVLAMTSYNLGIVVRQKWMFAPMLIFLLMSMLGGRRSARVAR